MTKIIGIASGKGGVGKTTTVVNLAAALTEMGYRVCIVDGNVTTSNLGLHLGVTDYPSTIHDVLKGRIKMIDAVFVHPSEIHVVTGSLTLADARGVNVKSFKKELKLLSKYYEFIIVDTSPTLENNAVKIIEGCDNLLIVTTPELPAITDAIKIIEHAKEKEINILGIIINRYKGKPYEITPEEIYNLYRIPVVAIIPEEEEIQKSIAMRIPVVLLNPKIKASVEFYEIARQISGVKERKPPPLFKLPTKKK
jgi:septum site-determining protein MinD